MITLEYEINGRSVPTHVGLMNDAAGTLLWLGKILLLVALLGRTSWALSMGLAAVALGIAFWLLVEIAVCRLPNDTASPGRPGIKEPS